MAYFIHKDSGFSSYWNYWEPNSKQDYCKQINSSKEPRESTVSRNSLSCPTIGLSQPNY
jgi:hypothetical protein